MSFADDLRRFVVKCEGRSNDVFVRSAQIAHESIQNGSPVTGAPGQPVDWGVLKNSWLLEFPEAGVAEITTPMSYAPIIEEGGDRSAFAAEGKSREEMAPALGISPPPKGHAQEHIKSTVGGSHSVKLTRAGWQRIVDTATAEMGE